MRLGSGRWTGSLSTVVAAVLVYGLFRLAVRPAMVRELVQAEDEVAALTLRRDQDGAENPGLLGKEATELAGELTRTRRRVAALGGILATPGEAESVLQSLGNTALAVGVRFQRFAPEPEYRLDGFLASAASVVAEGTFFDFVNFFERLSLSPYLVLVEDLTLEGTASGVLRGQFTAVTVRAAEAGVDAAPNVDPVSGASEPEEPAKPEGWVEGESGK